MAFFTKIRDMALSRFKYPAATLGGVIGFGISVLILAKMPDIQTHGPIQFLSKSDNVLVCVAGVGFSIIFCSVIGALFDKPPVKTAEDTSHDSDCER